MSPKTLPEICASDFTRDIDLSQGAAHRIGLPGVGQVAIEVINKTELYIPKHGDWGVF